MATKITIIKSGFHQTKMDGAYTNQVAKERDSAHIDTKLEGLERMNQIARNQGLDTKVQRLDGTISTEGNTYPRSRDRFPPRG